MKFIITAGGQGTKLWPYSTVSRPKHFQNIVNDHSPFEMAVTTLLKQYSSDDIYISTKKSYVGLVLQQAPQIGFRNLIIEPDIQKNRGPAEGFAFLTLSMQHPDEPFMVIQADNLRQPEEAYLRMIDGAEKLVKRDKKFISGGIKATYPILGVDYLRLGEQVDTDSALEIYKVAEFLERNNDYYKTKDLIQNFHIVVHSNHSCWYPDLMLDAYKKYRPDWYEALMKIKDTLGKSDEEAKISEIYATMEAGATEQVTKFLLNDDGYIVSLPFKWTDVGTWGTLYEHLAKENEIYCDGKMVAVDSKNSLVKIENKNKLVAVYGADNLVVIDTNDILLIMPKDKAEKISLLLDEVKNRGFEEYL